MYKVYVTLTCIAVFFSSSLTAQTIAFDSAGTAAYSGGWSNGSNGGDGFNAWVINAGANTGSFIGNPANDQMGTAGIGTKAFGIFATGTAFLNATRTFKQALQIGDELSFYWAMNFDAGVGAKGFDIRSGTSTVFNINNGNASPRITSSAETALFDYGTKPMLVKLKRTASDLYSFSMTGRVDGENYSTTINTALPIDGISFYIGNQNDNNGRRNIYFNQFNITRLTSSVTPLRLNKGLRIYPNPLVPTSTMTLHFSDFPAGKYAVNILQLSGMRMRQIIVTHPGGSSAQPISLNGSLKPGIYIAQVQGGGRTFQQKLVITE
jgi:hypothetical protein